MAVEFTAGAMAEAYEEPVIHHGRLTYRGRVLSAPEWFMFWDRYLTLQDRFEAARRSDGSVDAHALLALERTTHKFYLDYLRAVFPARRFRFWAPDVIRLLARGHPRDLREAFDTFFSLQARAMARREPQTDSAPTAEPAMAGTSSPLATPAAPASV